MAQSDSVEEVSSEFNEQSLINPELRVCPQIVISLSPWIITRKVNNETEHVYCYVFIFLCFMHVE
jgi:hypothetical protein